MSGPVDVLAVIDGDLFVARRGTDSDYLEALELAHAAVSELIAAAAAVEALATRHEGDDRMFDRLHAALARVGGAA